MLYLILKSLHIISVVTWFAGLFYLGRLFVYHKEIEQKPVKDFQTLHEQFTIMERRLWLAIMQPSMVVALICGIALAWLSQSFTAKWLLIKIVLVSILIAYHFFCDKIRMELATGSCSWNGRSLRLFNEIPSVLLVGIVFVVVLKESLSLWILSLLLVLFTVFIASSVFVLAKKNRKKIQ